MNKLERKTWETRERERRKEIDCGGKISGELVRFFLLNGMWAVKCGPKELGTSIWS